MQLSERIVRGVPTPTGCTVPRCCGLDLPLSGAVLLVKLQHLEAFFEVVGSQEVGEVAAKQPKIQSIVQTSLTNRLWRFPISPSFASGYWLSRYARFSFLPIIEGDSGVLFEARLSLTIERPEDNPDEGGHED